MAKRVAAAGIQLLVIDTENKARACAVCVRVLCACVRACVLVCPCACTQGRARTCSSCLPRKR